VPETVRRALNLSKRDKIHYTIRPGGEVVLTRANTSADGDPVLGPQRSSELTHPLLTELTQ